MELDPISRTISAALLSYMLLSINSPILMGLLSTLCLAFSIGACRKHPVLILGIVAPILPIGVSHFAIEPFFTKTPIDGRALVVASIAALRVSGLTALTLAWIFSLNLRAAAAVARTFLVGQWALVPASIIVSAFGAVSYRWTSIREISALRRTGSARHRRHTPLMMLPTLGLQLSLATFTAVGDLELTCRGRRLMTRRQLAAPLIGPTPLGLFAIAGCVAVLLYRSNIETYL